MSFGFSISDIVGLIQITTKTIAGTKKACGEYNDLAREVLSLHDVLEHLHCELSDPSSLLYHAGKARRLELRSHVSGCEKQLLAMDAILEKYNSLGDEERGSVWQKIRFGNGEVGDLDKTRLKLATFTSAIRMSLQLLSLGSQGRVEREISRQSGDIRGIREDINMLFAKRDALSREGSRAGGSIGDSIYSNDDPAFWRGLRKDLNRGRFPSRVLKPHKHLILEYVKELSDRGILEGRMGRSQASLVPSGEMESSSIHERFMHGVVEGLEATTLDIMTGEPRLWQTTCEDEEVERLRYVYDEPLANYPTENISQDTNETIETESFDEDLEILPSSVTHLGGSLPTNVSEEMAEMAMRIEYLETLNHQTQEALEAATRSRIETESRYNNILVPVREEESKELVIAGAIESNLDHTTETKESSGLESQIESSMEAHTGSNMIHYSPSEKESMAAEDETAIGESSTPIDVFECIIYPEKPSNEIVQYIAPVDLWAEMQLLSLEEKKKVIHFRDSIGRKYIWPYHLTKTWEGIVELIQLAFVHVDIIGPHIRKRRFDLADDQGLIILPQVWESIIQPSQRITMHMFPLPLPRPPPMPLRLRLSPIMPPSRPRLIMAPKTNTKQKRKKKK